MNLQQFEIQHYCQLSNIHNIQHFVLRYQTILMDGNNFMNEVN